jgi:glycosyltransferase involved in cell wall biosynthesis
LKISIITVCLNRQKVIRETIESVLSQNYNNIEYILIDGGSSDGSLESINSYSSDIDYLISEPDNGIYNAINKGLLKATGDIVGLLHAGDLFYDNNVISNVVNCFKQGDSDLIYGHSVVYTEDRKKIIRKNVSPKYKDNLMKFGWFPSHQSIYVKSSVFDQCGGYNEDYKIAADYEFLLRVLLVHKLKAKRLDMFLLKFHLGGVSSKNIMSVVESNYECFIAWKNNNLTIPFYTLPLKVIKKIIQIIFQFFRVQ